LGLAERRVNLALQAMLNAASSGRCGAHADKQKAVTSANSCAEDQKFP